MLQVSISKNQCNTLHSLFSEINYDLNNKLELLFRNLRLLMEANIPEHEIIKTELNTGSGIVKISGFPLDNNLEDITPKDGKCPLNKSHITECCVLGITLVGGFTPFAYEEEKNGVLVHEIVPISSLGKSIFSNGIEEFDFHTDGAYLERYIRPHTLA